MNYDLNNYQTEALSFRLPSADSSYALLNLGGEVGELYSLLAKGIRDGRQADYAVNVKKELGDILWCLAAVAADHRLTLADLAQGNIDKLTARKKNNTLTGSGANRE